MSGSRARSIWECSEAEQQSAAGLHQHSHSWFRAHDHISVRSEITYMF
jgi:hypothetical protein